MKLSFLGAVEGVTGSSFLVQVRDKNILIDCGMYQGKDEDLNEASFNFIPSDIECLFLSHSHIDHSGRIPLLVKEGFKGGIYSSKATYELCEIMLYDSAHIQKNETEWENKKRKRAGKDLIEPLYTDADVAKSLELFKIVPYDEVINVCDDVKVKYNDAGHILGSSIIEMWITEGEEEIKLVYSGDIGMKEKPIIKEPSFIKSADYLIMESTYGNKVHDDIDKSKEELINIILNTARRGGNIVIPSFAVGRTQEIIYELNKYYDNHTDIIGTVENELKKLPVYVDSPLAIKATEVFRQNTNIFDEEATSIINKGDDPLEFENLHYTYGSEESKMINIIPGPKIIISASGMCEAGRIRHHLKHNLWKKEASIVFVGYQADGTLGRRILEKEKDLKILGEDIHVNAEIYNMQGFSGHADKVGLLDWIKHFEEKPKKVFIVHGEDDTKISFSKEIEETIGIDCIIPAKNNSYELSKNQILKEDMIEPSDDFKVRTIVAPSDRNNYSNLENIIELLETEILNTEKLIKNEKTNKRDDLYVSNKIIELEKNLKKLKKLTKKK